MLSGLEPFRQGPSKRAGSPKLIVWNNALIHAMAPPGPAQDPRAWRGRLVENAVGAHILNRIPETERSLYYWRERDWEVDFVLKTANGLWAIEVKSGRPRPNPGLERFLSRHPKARSLVVGGPECPLQDFFSDDLGSRF